VVTQLDVAIVEGHCAAIVDIPQSKQIDVQLVANPDPDRSKSPQTMAETENVQAKGGIT